MPWTDLERAAWRARQRKQRSHHDDVVSAIDALRGRGDLEVIDYGRLDTGPDGVFPLLAIRVRAVDPSAPWLLVTGGVHGYETSGVHGALRFARDHAAAYAGRANLLVVPCVSPWAYERIQRWNPHAIDPNRSFRARADECPAEESAALVRLVAASSDHFAMHVDLHETTDSDETEFRPALAARDGKVFEPGTIPDGFYLVDDEDGPSPDFQAAILAAVAKVTHLAPADPDGTIIGAPIVAPAVIRYACRALGLCAGMTDAPHTTTTEVYPDSPRTTPAECIEAQVAAVRAGIDFVLARHVAALVS